MRYFEVYAWTDCPFCVHAKELLLEKNEQFVFCCIDHSDKLLLSLKSKYNWATVPIIIEKYIDNDESKFIGGFTDLSKYLNT